MTTSVEICFRETKVRKRERKKERRVRKEERFRRSRSRWSGSKKKNMLTNRFDRWKGINIIVFFVPPHRLPQRPARGPSPARYPGWTPSRGRRALPGTLKQRKTERGQRREEEREKAKAEAFFQRGKKKVKERVETLDPLSHSISRNKTTSAKKKKKTALRDTSASSSAAAAFQL